MDHQPDEDHEDQKPPEFQSEEAESRPPEPAAEAPEPEAQSPRPSREQALAEVRQSLREEEQQRKPGLFERLKGVFKKRPAAEPEAPAEPAEARLEEALLEIPPAEPYYDTGAGYEEPPQAEAEETVEPPVEEAAPEAPQPAGEEEPVIHRLARELWGEEPASDDKFTPREPEPEPEEPRRSILTGLHEEPGTEAEEYTDIREAAIGGYVEEPEEAVPQPQPSLRKTARRAWRDMRPLERSILVGTVVVIAAAILLGGGFLLARPFLPAPPAPTPTPSDLPYPITLSMPGGWNFTLRKGAVQNGKWQPTGAEWLEGTEVCRWVSLPWSVQLEAVVRTLKADDEITLGMSNYDRLTYKVKSIEQVSADQMAVLQSDEPCLLVILSRADSDQRWVVTANP
ncbi:MAG: hypothetical protein ACM3QS_08005 [Bacteroidota bacterium]